MKRMNRKKIGTYLRIMRPDHWIKQLFILPGIGFALYSVPNVEKSGLVLRIILGFMAACLIASANYVINEWLDRDFDRYHPVKKHRSIVENGADARIVYLLYAVLTAAGLLLEQRLQAGDTLCLAVEEQKLILRPEHRNAELV